MKRTFEFNDGKSNKFWTIEVSGDSFTVTFGKIGTAGQSQTKAFSDEGACLKEAEKLIREKTKKGYAEAGGEATTPVTKEKEAAKSSSAMPNVKSFYKQYSEILDTHLTEGDKKDMMGIKNIIDVIEGLVECLPAKIALEIINNELKLDNAEYTLKLELAKKILESDSTLNLAIPPVAPLPTHQSLSPDKAAELADIGMKNWNGRPKDDLIDILMLINSFEVSEREKELMGLYKKKEKATWFSFTGPDIWQAVKPIVGLSPDPSMLANYSLRISYCEDNGKINLRTLQFDEFKEYNLITDFRHFVKIMEQQKLVPDIDAKEYIATSTDWYTEAVDLAPDAIWPFFAENIAYIDKGMCLHNPNPVKPVMYTDFCVYVMSLFPEIPERYLYKAWDLLLYGDKESKYAFQSFMLLQKNIPDFAEQLKAYTKTASKTVNKNASFWLKEIELGKGMLQKLNKYVPKVMQKNGVKDKYYHMVNHLLPKDLAKGFTVGMEEYKKQNISEEVVCYAEGTLVFMTEGEEETFYEYKSELLTFCYELCCELKLNTSQEAGHWMYDAIKIAKEEGAFKGIDNLVIWDGSGDVMYESGGNEDEDEDTPDERDAEDTDVAGDANAIFEQALNDDKYIPAFINYHKKLRPGGDLEQLDQITDLLSSTDNGLRLLAACCVYVIDNQHIEGNIEFWIEEHIGEDSERKEKLFQYMLIEASEIKNNEFLTDFFTEALDFMGIEYDEDALQKVLEKINVKKLPKLNSIAS